MVLSPTRASIFAPIVLLASVGQAVVPSGDSCSPPNDRLDVDTGRFTSDCEATAFCSQDTGTCQPRQCRRDQFPSEYSNTTALPPLCGDGSYCPDEGSGCLPLVTVGGACQIDRDEQCAPPEDASDLASSWNHNGALCLKGVCMFANVTLGQPCMLDVWTYTEGAYRNTIMRHNCETPKFYCDEVLKSCIPTKGVGSSCAADQECVSYNCDTKGVCAQPFGTPARVKAWQLVLTGMSIAAAMVATVVVLTLIHKRLRLKRCREIRDYYDEQIGLRKSLATLYATVADGYVSEKGM